MSLRKLFAGLFAVAFAVLGLVAATLSTPARAASNDITAEVEALWSMGYVLGLRSYPSASSGNQCYMMIVLRGNGAPTVDGTEIVIGDLEPTHADYCASSPAEIRARIAKLIADYPPQPATTTTSETPPEANTTTVAPSDTPAPATAPDAPGTVTVTVTDPTVDAKLAAIQAQLDALSHRVDAIAQANTAAWTAFVDAIGTGASAADAALAARSAGLNAIYGL